MMCFPKGFPKGGQNIWKVWTFMLFPKFCMHRILLSPYLDYFAEMHEGKAEMLGIGNNYTEMNAECFLHSNMEVL